MPLGLRCPACRHKFVPGEPSADGKVACPGCGRSLRVPKENLAPADPLVGRAIAGHVLQRRIGSGAMAAVYEGRPIAGGTPAAIKMLTSEAAKDDETVKRFRREAALAQAVEHPHVVRVAGHGTENGVHWMAMELVSGDSLEQLIDRRGRIAWREAMRLVRQIAEALGHLAARGIIHRDVKPANILVTADGVAKLTDLGFGKALHAAEDPEGGLTLTGTAMGSPAYMAPEQVLDAKQAGPPADLYGLGATLYHAVTGRTPFDGKNAYQVMEQVIAVAPPPPREIAPEVPTGVAAFIDWAMAKKPEHRPPDAAAWIAALDAVVAAPDDDGHVTRSRPAMAKPRSARWLVVAGIAVALIAGVAVAWWLRGR